MRKIYSFLLLTCLLLIGTNAWADSWVKTAPADLQSNDVVVIVDLTQNKAMSNNNGTANPPSSVGVTLNQEKTEITSTVTANIQWTLVVGGTQETPTYQFWNGNSYLYVTANNNGVRVGSGERNTFTIVTGGENNGYYLYNSANDDNRFVGDYNASNWRCYGTINSNIKGNNNAFFKKVVDESACATPTFSVDEGYYSSTQNVEITCATEGATIHYTLNGSEPTENSTTYSSAIAISETTTIKAIAVKENYTNSSVASATYNIVTVQHAGTAQDPYTVADARNAIDLGTGLTGVYATGIVSEIVDDYSTTFYNITFDIIDEGGSDVLRAYRCGGAEAANVEVGDTVVVSGSLVKYNGIYEYTQGCQIVSLKHPVAPAVPSIDVEETSINATAEETVGTITVTYNNISEISADVYFCDAEGNSATYDWLDAEINASNNVEYLIEANTGAARTAYMKVWALDDQDQGIYSELITISQAEYVNPASYIALVAEYKGCYYAINKSFESKTFSATAVDAVNGKVVNGKSDNISWKITEDGEGNATIVNKDGTTYIGYSGNDLNTNNTSWVIDNENASWKTSNNRYFYYRASANGFRNYSAQNIDATGYSGYTTAYAFSEGYVRSGITGTWGTICLPSTVEAEDLAGATFYSIAGKVMSGETPVSLVLEEETDGLLAGIPYIFELDAESTKIVAAYQDDEEDASSYHGLVGTFTAISVDAPYYLISGDAVVNAVAGSSLPANRAYIDMAEVPVYSPSATAPVRIIAITNGEYNATNIQNVEGAENAVKFIENGNLYIEKNGVVYSTIGQRVK